MKRFAVIGCGFWSNYQVAAWYELENVKLVAVCNPTISKAIALAAKYEGVNAYSDVDEMLSTEKIDFVDIITSGATHRLMLRKQPNIK